MKQHIFIGILSILAFTAKAQEPTVKPVVSDAGDSMLIKAFRAAFNSTGGYYYETMMKSKVEKFQLQTHQRKIGPVYWDKAIATTAYKALVANAFYADSTKKTIYFKNKAGTRIYGPKPGRIREILEYGKENVAAELSVGATSYLYINDSLVTTFDTGKQTWQCAFSDNNHNLYTYQEKGIYKLFYNYKLIDTSSAPFGDIDVNDNGFYIYSKANKGLYTLHAGDKTFGPFGKVEYSSLNSTNNGYAFWGCADTQCYVLVNGRLYNKINQARSYTEDPATGDILINSDEEIHIEVSDENNYAFTYNTESAAHIFLNINGKEQPLNYSSSSPLSISPQGFALFGYRPDTLGVERPYKCVNGKESKLAYLKKKSGYNIHPVIIQADGSNLYFYAAKDSVYCYRNDVLLSKAVAKKKFSIWNSEQLPQNTASGYESFAGVNLGTVSYIAYKNTLSKPLPPINTEYSRFEEPRKGDLIAGGISDDGFYVLICTDKGKYQLIINNSIYKDITEIDEIYGDQTIFKPHQLVLYGRKGNTVNEYTYSY